jgi:hypothetical protein
VSPSTEVAVVVVGGLLILIPMVLNELEYRWDLELNRRKRELLNDRLRIEADYHIARLEKTNLENPPNRNGEDAMPKPPR